MAKAITTQLIKISEYENVDLTINARLFAWISTVAFGGKKIIKSDEE